MSEQIASSFALVLTIIYQQITDFLCQITAFLVILLLVFFNVLMKKNYLHHVLWLVLIILIALLAAYWLPGIDIAGVEMRRVDMLSEITGVDNGDNEADSVNLMLSDSIIEAHKPEFVDSCRSGMTCIEDYSDDKRGMSPFYEALRSSKSRPVRIAVLGDSYIEGDIFTADLRNMLQDTYGGCGVGFVPMSSETSGFRRSVIHKFGGWKEFSAVANHKRYDHNISIISGRYFYPDSSAWMQLSGQKTYCTHLNECEQSSIFLLSNGSNTITASINGGADSRTFNVDASNDIQSLTVYGNIHRVRWTSSRMGGDYVFYGASMDCLNGIILDNFSLRGCRGSNLAYLHDDMIIKFHRVRPYDLVILMYGLNVASSHGKDYGKYKQSMENAINKMKANMPGAGFLVISVGDREERVDGKFRTMRGVKNLIRYQQAIAADCGIAFWNLYEAMGGEGSIVKMVNSKPSEANLDYTHINFRGGRHLAKIFFETLQYGKDCYDRRCEYEGRKEGLRK